MKLVIIHNAAGEILVLGRVAEPNPKGPEFGMGFNPGPGQYLLEIDATGELPEKPVDQLHRECCVDTKAKKLIAQFTARS